MNRSTDRPVVAGVDGSDIALRAVRWGASEARRRRAPLHLVLAFTEVADYLVGHPGLGRRTREVLLERAGTCLGAAAAIARQQEPGIGVEERLVIGFPTRVLADESRRAQLVVVGERGLGRVLAAFAGSVAVSVAAHAMCPVVVVRGPERGGDDRRPVVVGVDGAPAGEAAIAFAFAAAADRRVPLVAVHTWVDPVLDPTRAAGLPDAVELQERRLLAERLAGWSAKYPDVPVQQVVSTDRPAHELLARSEIAQLVVVGSRGHGDLAGLLLGSVSNAVLHGAACPVAIVRPDSRDQA